MLKKLFQIFSRDKKIISLIFLGSLTWSLTMVKSGIVYLFGMGFWGPNGHDGVWHIALANSLAKGSWGMPIFAGEAIKNYHLGFDLLLAALNKLTFIPIHILYFQVLPPILATLVGFYSYKFILSWTKDKAKAYWGVFFVYFGGSWGWIVNLFRGQELGGETMFWSQQSVSTLINPPFALSLVLIFAGLYYLINGMSNNKKRELVAATFLFGILVQIKVYAGILILTALFIAGIWNLLKRLGLSLIKVFMGSLVVSILIFTPMTNEIGQVMIFKPFWFLETMMGFSDRIGWTKFGEAMVNYKLAGNLLKAIPAYFIAFLIFWFGNLGTRVIKEPLFIKNLKNFKVLSYIEIFLYSVIGLGVLIPTFFIQSGTPWNTIQFMYYSLIFSGILAGISLVELIYKSKLNASMISNSFRLRIIEVVVVFLTIPTTLGVLYYHYLPMRPPAMISKAELEALSFLSKQPDGIVLTQPFDRDKADAAVDNPPRPLYLYESTAYVSAFSGKPTYLEDEVNLEITGYDWISRRKEVEIFLTDPAFGEDSEFLDRNNIGYLYLVKNIQEDLPPTYLNTDKILENDEVIIYRVN